MNNPTVTVLMPAFNRERYIGHAIESILTQTYRDLILLIYNDGSKDHTQRIIDQYSWIDPRVRSFGGSENRGVAFARNRLLIKTGTEIACWQDSDDVAHVRRLENQYRAIRDVESPIVYSTAQIYQEPLFTKRVIEGEEWKKDVRAGGKRMFATAMFRIDGVGTFDESMFSGEDTKWSMTIESRSGKSPVDPRIFYFVRFHDDRIGVWKRKRGRM